MKLLLLALTLLLARPSWDDLVRVRAEAAQLAQKRNEAAGKLDQQSRAVDDLKRKAGQNPVERARLESTMAQAQDLAKKLAALDGQLAAKRREVIAAADRVLADERDAGLRAQAMQARADAAAALATLKQAQVGAALGVKEATTDGPEDLREKADLLKDTEDKVRRELAVLDKRMAAAERRGELQRSMRSLENDVFFESSRRQRSDQQRGGSTLADKGASSPTAGGAAGAPAPGLPPPQSGGGDFTSPQAPTSSPGGSLTDVIVLKDVLDPTTLSDLGQPHDSQRYVKALERARARLRSLADDLEQRSLALRKRADELRKK